MPAVMAPEVLADPISVAVSLVCEQEPALDRKTVTDVVVGIAGGRAKRRRLAQALLDQPQVLADGRSPAPSAVADLLIALHRAGAVHVAQPVCAECGKHLRAIQRRGEHWYCSVCVRQPQRCSSCGQQQTITTRDREGQPRCGQCLPGQDRDPLALLTELVINQDPTLTTQDVAEAVSRVFSRPGNIQRLAWAIEDRPELLAGAGALAPMPGVLRLIDALCDAGARNITRPACPACRRVTRLHRRIAGQWLCRNCVAKSRARPCARCGAVRETAARDEHGQPLCPTCLVTDPANLEDCVGCGRRRRVSVRSEAGPLCETCRPIRTMTCSVCGRDAPCYLSKATGLPCCTACKQRRAQCSGCGQVRPIRGGTLGEPLCATCTRDDPEFWHDCPGCGEPGRILPGRCARCAVHRRLREVLGDASGEIRPHLRALHDALGAADRPSTVVGWLDSAAPNVLNGLAPDEPLTHDALDRLPEGKPVEHLRSILVAIGTLPHRDEHMARLERWIADAVAARPDTDERELLHRYAVWHVTRRLRGRLAGADATRNQAAVARRNIRAAITLLDWLASKGLTLAQACQGDLDTWLANPESVHRAEAGNFVRWARRQKLTQLDFAAARWGGPTGAIDTEARWEQARRLLHDDTLKPEDRLAGLLVLLYAQRATTISLLTLDHLHDDGEQVRIRLGSEPIVLPEPLAGLARHVAATRRGHAVIGGHRTSLWLFPGGQPGRPISGFRMNERLNQLGIHTGRSRSAALFQLATDLPAAVLARMLGTHISVAAAWQRASSGDWATYAAEVSRRTRSQQPPRQSHGT